jgi:hypothetical protein
MKSVRVLDRIIVCCIASLQLLYCIYILVIASVGRAPTVIFVYMLFGVVTALALFTGRLVARFIAILWLGVYVLYLRAKSFDVNVMLWELAPIAYLFVTGVLLLRSKSRIQVQSTESESKIQPHSK